MPRAEGLMFCGGGTGGHVIPGLALASACRERGARRLRWVGDPERIEARLVPAADIPLLPFGLSRPRLRSPAWWWLSLRRAWACGREFLRAPPQVVIVMGGYAALLPGLLAGLLRRPLVICEQNAWPGRTNRLLARYASLVVTQFAEAARPLPRGKVRCLGSPVRQLRPRPRGQTDTLTLLVMGGSLAARSLNDLLCASAAELAKMPSLRLIHLAGSADCARVEAVYRQVGLDAEVYGFVDDMASLYERADLALSRAGATTLSECCAAGLGAILVPLPWAAEDHQSANARALARVGGAVLLRQADCTPAALTYLLRRCMADHRLLSSLGAGALRLARPQAGADIAAACASLALARAGRLRW